jgi:NAD(P)-dependent dehydrogenase (short-subunit alcohol dehydrogenase family)
MARLLDKVALVTGSARGIGKACAEAFAREGARVVVTDVDEAAGRALADALGSAALWQPLDVRVEPHWESAISVALARFGRLDALVNNAGITGFDPPTGPHDPEHVSLDAWRAVHATNLDGTLLGCKHAIRAMKPPAGRGGSIINLSSRSGLVGVSGAAAYASSKAAIRNLSKKATKSKVL